MTVIVEVALDDPDPTVDSATYDWSDWSAYVERDQQGVYLWRGYRDGSDEPGPTEIRFRGKNGDLRWHIEHPNNPFSGRIHERTPIRVSRDIGGVTVRAVGLLAEVTIIEDVNGEYLAADIVAFGPLHWVEEGQPTSSILRGQLSTWVAQGDVVAYWPGEDDSGSTSIRSAVPGQPDITSAYLISAGSDADVTGSRPLWTFAADDSSIRAVLAPYARPHPEAWAVQFAIKIPEAPPSGTFAFAIYPDGGSVWAWLVEITPGTPTTFGTLELLGVDTAGTDLLTGTKTIDFALNGSEPYDRLVGITVTAEQNGADIDWSLHLSGPGGSVGQAGTLAAATHAPAKVLGVGPDAKLNGWTQGHWAVWNNTTDWQFIDFDGRRGESTNLAWFQAAVEAGLPVALLSGDTSTSTTGVLASDIPVSTMKLLTRSEGGLMYETADANVVLAQRTDLYAQAVALTIDRGNRQLMSLTPIRDGFRRANQVTVNNSAPDAGGVTVDAPEPYDPATAGYTRNRPLDVNLESDDQATGAGQWEAALLSHPDLRYRLSMELMGPAAGLRAAYLSNVDIGTRIQVTNNPAHSTLDTIDQQVMGIEEWHTVESFRAALNTRPAALWAEAFIAETGAGNLSRADTAGTALLVAVDDNDTALLVGTRGQPGDTEGKWSTSSVPYDLALRTRDRVTCTAVTNRTPTFVAAGTAAHADYANITPGAAAGMQAGDCELLFTAIRLGAGSPYVTGVAGRRKVFTYDQTGWTRLARFGGQNGCFQLWGRTWQDSTLTPPPTLVPEGGAAGDTISAQTCAFRYLQPVTHTVAVPLSNASAQNVAYPGLGIVRPSCVAIMALQKEDDWTSVASPAGWTEIGEPDSTSGSDQGIAWYYQIQTTATNTDAGSAVVTGGASAVSRSTVISLISDVQTLTVTRGVNGALTSHPVGADVRLWRAGRAVR